MAEILLINRDDIMTLTGLNGNVDTEKILPQIKSAQDIHLQTIIGTKLLDKCKELVEAGTLDDAGNEDYKELIEVYIAPLLVHYSMVDLIPFLAFEFANGGVFQHQSENSATPDVKILNSYVQKHKDKAEFYGRRLEGYICEEGVRTFPELSTTDSKDMPPNLDELFNGWVL